MIEINTLYTENETSPLADEGYRQNVKKSASSIKTIRKAARPKVEDYLVVGEYLYRLGCEVPSTKLRHKRMKEEHPELLSFDQALRSNSKRLYEALIGYRDTDLLDVLGITNIHDLYTTNPTVIFRKYRKAKSAS